VRLRSVAAAALVAAALIACSVGSVDFSSKACPCGTGYVCDTVRDLCVLPSGLGGSSTDGGGGGPTTAPDGSVAGDGGGCVVGACPCGVDGDCKDRVLPHCGPSKTCVGCVAQSDCGSGTYCSAQNECVLGCKEESDCQISPLAPHCDLSRHQCVECRSLGDCAGEADRCSPSGQCVQGCNLDAGQLCTGGKQCCQGLCIDTTKDLLNCGGCGIACSTQNGTPACAASACSWACAPGFDHCSTTNSGCETSLRGDPAHCGSCTTDCGTLVANATGILCTAAVCDYTSCTANHDNCDGVRSNGCECSCGTKKNERCCPGGMCNAVLTCNAASNKCN
jgi:hypothetical protein